MKKNGLEAPKALRRPSRASPSAPDHLERIERALWKRLTSDFEFNDAASIALLSAAMEAHQRARRCREAIDKDGEAIKDRFEQIKPHPLLAAERDARSAFLGAMKALNLDLGGA